LVRRRPEIEIVVVKLQSGGTVVDKAAVADDDLAPGDRIYSFQEKQLTFVSVKNSDFL
jgi:hypothetical protein